MYDGWRSIGNHTYLPENPDTNVDYVNARWEDRRVLTTGFTMYEGLDTEGAITVNEGFPSGGPPLKEINSTDLQPYSPIGSRASATYSSNQFAVYPTGGSGGFASGGSDSRHPLKDVIGP